MVIWGLVIGALLGWTLSSWGLFGAVLGGIIGAVAMQWLRSEIRAEISSVLDGRDFRPAEPELQARPVAAPEAPTAMATAAPIQAETRAEAPPEPSPPALPPEAPAPAEDDADPVIDIFGMARGWLFGGNTIVRVGLILLFVGLSFLARYAAMAGLFPIEARLALVAAAGIALLVTGFLRRQARPEFGLALLGGGVAVIYLTLFAAARFYDLLPLLPAFVLMLLVCTLGCALALLQGSLALAMISFIGGFAVPLLLGGDGSSVALFGYYALLNLAVLGLVWRKGWRPLGLIAFFATFGVMGTWVADAYTPADYGSTEAFLALFMLVQVALAVLAAQRRPGAMGQIVDTTQLFGPALAGLGIQIALVRHLELGDAFSALGFAALYIVAAALVRQRGGSQYRVLVDALLAIGVGALTLAVPLAFGARWTSAVWAVEGAAAVWIGARQARWLPRLFGVLLIAVATLFFLIGLDANITPLPVIGRQTLGAGLIALAMVAAAWWLRRPLPGSDTAWSKAALEVEAVIRSPLFLAGFLMWCLAIGMEVYRFLPPLAEGAPAKGVIPIALRSPSVMLGILVSAAVAQTVGRRFAWPVATWPSRVTLLVIVVVFARQVLAGYHVIDWPVVLFWVAALALHLLCLYRNDQDSETATEALVQRAGHVGGVWLLLAMLTDAVQVALADFDMVRSDWRMVGVFVSRIALLSVLALWAGRANRAATTAGFGWPLNRHAIGYWWQAAVVVAGLQVFNLLLVAFTGSGAAAPLPYLPLFNPVDLSLALAIGSLMLWRRVLATAEPQPVLAASLAGSAGTLGLAGLGFLILNSVWLRIAHHYLGVPWALSAMLSDSSVQAGLAILWTLLALGLMVAAHRRVQRPLWLAGAGLLGAVVLKLLLVDMSNAAGGQRIIAFIGVGVLMLVVGYFVPLPPKPKDDEVPA